MPDRKIYDVIGIGIGPFNLGLAAMCETIPQLDCIFFDQSPAFEWHGGMLLSNARLQVPFYADLVTPVNPCSRFTYLNYLKEKKKLFQFAIHENNFITRKEYNSYCEWVVSELNSLHFHHRVEDVVYDAIEKIYTVMVHNLSSDSLVFYYTRHLVVGIGSVPDLTLNPSPKGEGPNCLERSIVIHSSEYLVYKEQIVDSGDVTIVGSGQSAAEIFYDLLQYTNHIDKLSWFTRSARFYPMEYSKLSLEMTSPDYIEHFYSLPHHKKKEVLRTQDQLYKGINYSLVNEIYDALYVHALEHEQTGIALHTNTALQKIVRSEEGLQLQFYHNEIEHPFEHSTKALVLATGYKNATPHFLSSIKEHLLWDDNGAFDVGRNYAIDVSKKQVFVQNAELDSHGFTAPDLGMGPYRNAVILNSILGYEYYHLESRIAFQTFGLPM